MLAPRWLRVFWTFIASVISFTLLQVSGAKAVQPLRYIMGLPLAVLAYLVFVLFVKR